MWLKGGRAMGAPALVGMFALVAIEYAANGGSLTPRGPTDDPGFHATLARGACLGSCPVYRVDLDASGRVQFAGQPSGRSGYGVCKGPVRWQVPPASVARLESVVDGSGFARFKASYIAGITDQPLFVVTITRHGRTSSVKDYAGGLVGMPAAVSALEDAIDEAADDKRCIGDATHPLKGPSSIP